MKRSALFVFILLILTSFKITDDSKLIDLKAFSIVVPKNWKYKPLQGEDSFIGRLKLAKATLDFDFSDAGYANSLIPTEQEYINGNDWLMQLPCPFCKVDVTYTGGFNIKSEKLRQMKEKGITDSTLVKVETFPDFSREIHTINLIEKQKYPDADYIATLTYKDSTIIVPIQIPVLTKSHNIRVDSTDKYITKTVWPKNTGYGFTGIYFRSRKGRLTFNLGGYGLSRSEQSQALTAFKTIKISE